MALDKRYEYKVYSAAGALIGRWADVASEFSIAQEINSAGSELKVTLARPADNFGEGVDVDFNLDIKVYLFDDQAPNGQLVFNGFIANYKPVYGDTEKVEVTVLSYGFELDKYIISSGTGIAISQPQSGATERGFNNTLTVSPYLGQGFKTTASMNKITSIVVRMRADSAPYLNYRVAFRLWDSYAAATNTANYTGDTGYMTGSKVVGTVPNTSMINVEWQFDNPITVLPNTNYWWTVQGLDLAGSGEPTTHKVAATQTNVYADGYMFRFENGTGNVEYLNDDVTFWVYSPGNSTTAPYYSVDPSTILMDILTNFNTNGGTVSYSGTIDLTGTTVTYQFNTNSVLEGIKKVLELAPAGWYWYLDQATNLIHFHQKSGSVQHNFTLGKDIIDLQPEKRTEDVVNTIYFTGGEVGGVNLFKQYEDTTSVANYGRRVLRVSDNRVTVSSTADTIAASLLETRAAPSLRVSINIADNAYDSRGYDIESVKVGQMVSFKGFGAANSSLWDVMLWDVGYWDYNIRQLETLLLQVVRLDYSPSKIELTLSTVPPDVNKRIEDINRALESVQTQNNPEVAD